MSFQQINNFKSQKAAAKTALHIGNPASAACFRVISNLAKDKTVKKDSRIALAEYYSSKGKHKKSAKNYETVFALENEPVQKTYYAAVSEFQHLLAKDIKSADAVRHHPVEKRLLQGNRQELGLAKAIREHLAGSIGKGTPVSGQECKVVARLWRLVHYLDGSEDSAAKSAGYFSKAEEHENASAMYLRALDCKMRNDGGQALVEYGIKAGDSAIEAAKAKEAQRDDESKVNLINVAIWVYRESYMLFMQGFHESMPLAAECCEKMANCFRLLNDDANAAKYHLMATCLKELDHPQIVNKWGPQKRITHAIVV